MRYFKSVHGKSAKGDATREGLVDFSDGTEYSITGMFTEDDYAGYLQFSWKNKMTKESMTILHLDEKYHLVDSKNGTHNIVSEDFVKMKLPDNFNSIKNEMKNHKKLSKMVDDLENLLG